MTALARGGDHDPRRARAEVDELLAMISAISDQALEPEIDPDEVAGPGGQAQENRAVRLARARSAAERARLARSGLHALVLRARAVTSELESQRVLREARHEFTGTERTMLADLWAVVPRYDRARPANGVVVELLEYARAVPGVAHAGITVWDRRGAVVWTEASDEVARALSAVQSGTGGPGRDAASADAEVHTGTAPGGDSAFAEAAADVGVRAVFSVPVHDGADTGSLDLHTRRDGGLDGRARTLGALLGRYADVALRLRAAAG